jgi:ribosomal protein S18 acetylase RimI-like enzyme
MDAPTLPYTVDPRRVEEAGLNALQTQKQLFYDGWLLRVSPGKAKRARSVNPHFASSLPLPGKIAYCERAYEERGLPVLFRMTPFVQPPDLEDALAARGYGAFEETWVQTATLDRPPDVPEPGDDVELSAPDVPVFVEAAGDLRGSPPEQRAAHRERLEHAAMPRRFVVVRAGGRPVCTGLVALEDGLAGIYDLVTAPDARRRGHATLACSWLLAWAWQRGARAAYLQVDGENRPAHAVYRRFGFTTLYTYHYRGRPGECR